MDDCVRGLSFAPFFPVYGRELHTVKRESGKCCLFCERKIFLSFTHPVFLASQVRVNFIPITSSILPPYLCFHLVQLHGSSFIPFACVDCHHLVLLHLKTPFRVLITALGLSSQTHPVALHILFARKRFSDLIPWAQKIEFESCK